MAPRSNRSLDDLKNSNDQLSGADGMALRSWAYQSPMVPSRDLKDPLGSALMSTYEGQTNAVRSYLDARLTILGDDHATLVKELYEKRWGPTRIPIYNVILTFCYTRPSNRNIMLNLTRYLTQDIKVPVDGTDVIGATALFWAISTSPFVEPQFAQILFDAGGSVNRKNRFGETTAFEMVKSMSPESANMMRWYMRHGGDTKLKDNDGINVVERMGTLIPGLTGVIEEGRGPRADDECANCGRKPSGNTAFEKCSRCKGRRYCSQECQKIEWRTHKKNCKAAA